MILQIADSVITDAAAAVFGEAEYARSRPSLLARAYRWIRDLLGPIGDGGETSAPLFWTMIVAGALVVTLIVGRAAYLARLRRSQHAADPVRAGRQAGGARQHDPWRAAEEFAASGEYTAAAHSLYQALLEAVARRERLRLHPAMTVGDYSRTLRTRSSSLFARFRDFAMSYETVVYGIGFCDRERYERLRTLALPIVQTDG